MKKIILIILALLMLGTVVMGQSIINQIGNSGSDSYRVRNGPTNANDLFIIRGSTGNLGLGILFPTEKFHLFGAGRQSFQIESSDNEASLILNGNHADGKWFIKNGANSKDLRFHVFSTAHGNGPRMTIKADGNVGIGTTTPTAKLHVVGEIKVDGNLNISTSVGALIVPRITTSQRNALANINGSIIYNITDDKFNFYENGSWVALND